MATAAVTNQFTASTTIVSDDVDTNFGDLVTFLNGSVLHLDGAKAMTGDLDMGAKNIDNVPWAAWSPSYNNLTIGNGTVIARYIQIGDLVVASFSFVLGSTSAVGSGPTISPPVTAQDSTNALAIGSLFLNVGGTQYTGVVRLTGGNLFISAQLASSQYLKTTGITSSVPETWASGDSIACTVVLEAA